MENGLRMQQETSLRGRIWFHFGYLDPEMPAEHLWKGITKLDKRSVYTFG